MLCSVALLNLQHQASGGSGGEDEMLSYPDAPNTPPPNSSSPAHGVIVVRVTEAGGFQLAAHHRAGALVARQVALKSTLSVHAGTCDTTDEGHVLVQAQVRFAPPPPLV